MFITSLILILVGCEMPVDGSSENYKSEVMSAHVFEVEDEYHDNTNTENVSSSQ